jgi:hypothetical protein
MFSLIGQPCGQRHSRVDCSARARRRGGQETNLHKPFTLDDEGRSQHHCLYDLVGRQRWRAFCEAEEARGAG